MAETYQVIARRWRPKKFDELVGQEHIVRTLKNAIEQKRIAHAYLFVGPRGTGKTSTARLFAKCLNCENGPNIQPSEDSEICKAIMRGACMDVIEIDGASNNSVDQVRNLREDCQYSPVQCKYKIYIIDEVHMLSTAAFNALLKTLEEPPPHVIFIFATTEAHKVLPTIVSRCQRFEFRPISEKVIADKLKTIAETEGIEIESAALNAIARLAGGGMRDAQSIFDQLISFCGKSITEQNILDVYGLASKASIEATATYMSQGEYRSLLQQIEQWVEEGRDLYRVLVDLHSHVREIFLEAVKSPDKTTKSLGPIMTAEALMRMLEVLHEGEGHLREGLSERVNFEITLLKAVERSQSRSIDQILRKITHLTSNLPDSEQDEKKNNVTPLTSIKNSFEQSSVNSEFSQKSNESIDRTEDQVEVREEILRDKIVNPAGQRNVSTQTLTNDENFSLGNDLQEAIDQLPNSVKQSMENLFRVRYAGVRTLDTDKRE